MTRGSHSVGSVPVLARPLQVPSRLERKIRVLKSAKPNAAPYATLIGNPRQGMLMRKNASAASEKILAMCALSMSTLDRTFLQ